MALHYNTHGARNKPDFMEAISWDGDDDEILDWDRICAIFEKILRILLHLETHGICHRDLSPDNFLFLTDDNLVAFDLAMSIRIPFENDKDNTRKRTIIRSQRRLCGTLCAKFSADKTLTASPLICGLPVSHCIRS